MKKSIVLLELILSILILSIVGIYSLLFINDLYKTNSQNLEILNSNLDLKINSLFLENILQNSLKIKASSQKIDFFEINKNDFTNGNYSGFTILEKSSKEYAYTPYSLTTKLNDKYIWFTDNYIYELKQSFEDNKLYFKNPMKSKRIFEQYKLLKDKSTIYLKGSVLYLNSDILLNNVRTFETKMIDNNLNINICTKLCQKLIIKI